MDTVEFCSNNISALYVEITSSCNLSCNYCYNDSSIYKNQYMNMDTFNNLLMSISSKKNISTIILSGGEPLIHPKIEDICTLISQYGLLYRIYTNGTLITPDFIKIIRKARPSIQITLDSSDQEINDKYKGKGSFKQIYDSIELLNKNYNMENVLIRCNLNYELLTSDRALRQYISLLKTLEVKYAFFSLINAQGRAKHCLFPTKIKDMRQIQEFSNRVKTLAIENDISITGPKIGVCHYCPYTATQTYKGEYIIHITPNGDVYPCNGLAYTNNLLGNINDSDILDIISGEQMHNFIRKVQRRSLEMLSCGKCSFRFFCGRGCLGESISADDFIEGDGQCEYRKQEIAQILKDKVTVC